MAPEQAPRRQPKALRQAMLIQRRQSVIGATGIKAALVADERAQGQLIGANAPLRNDQGSGSPSHCRNAVSARKQRGAARTRLVQRFRSCGFDRRAAADWLSHFDASLLIRLNARCRTAFITRGVTGARTCKTMSNCGKSLHVRRKASRAVRFSRFLSCARRTARLPTISPNRALARPLRTPNMRTGPA